MDIEENNGISLLTAHRSKGLQYDIVFIIGLSEGTFPDYRAVKAGGTQLSQEMNNMYVAVTRAKRLCYMTYPAKKQCLGEQSKRKLLQGISRTLFNKA